MLKVTLILCTFQNLRLRRSARIEGLGFGLGTLHEARSRRARLEFVEGGGCGKHLAKKWDSGSSCRLPGSSGDRRIRSTRVS